MTDPRRAWSGRQENGRVTSWGVRRTAAQPPRVGRRAHNAGKGEMTIEAVAALAVLVALVAGGIVTWVREARIARYLRRNYPDALPGVGWLPPGTGPSIGTWLLLNRTLRKQRYVGTRFKGASGSHDEPRPGGT